MTKTVSKITKASKAAKKTSEVQMNMQVDLAETSETVISETVISETVISETVINEPFSTAELEKILATIDPAMEHAASSGEIDHVTQVASWVNPEVAEEIRIEEIVQEIENLELSELSEITETTDTTTGQSDMLEIVSLESLIAKQNTESAHVMVARIAHEVNERIAFEQETESNPNIQKTLNKVYKSLVTLRAAKLLLATNVSPDFINRTVHTGKRYNVYALGKLADVIFGVTDGVISNAINIACMRTLFNLNAHGMQMTGEIAKGACSIGYARTLDAFGFDLHKNSPYTFPCKG